MHALQAPPSSRHSKVEPPWLALKEKLAAAEPLGSLGCAVIVVSGATVSIVQVKLAGEASVLPAVSVARTSKVCEPSARPGVALRAGAGGPGAAVEAALEARAALVDAKEKSGSAEFAGSFGCAVIDVFGAAVSTVQVNVAGVASVLPAASVARTSNVCKASARPV